MKTILIMRVSVAVLSIMLVMSMTGCYEKPIEDPYPIGGCGDYIHYSGTATILSVELAGESGPSSPSCYDGYKVLFSLSDNIAPLCSKDLGYYNNNIWTFTLINGWAPGPAYLDKYDIQTGAVFNCVLSVQRGGPCTPCIIEFEGVDARDYFECKR
jgi:hypothetical protein